MVREGKRDYDVWEERELRPGLALTVAFGHRNDPADIASISGGFGEAWVVHAHPDDPSAEWVKSREPCRDLDHSQTFQLATNWLLQCISEHEMCRDTQHDADASIFIPTRLIHINADILHEVKLEAFASRGHGDRNIRYAALSYCWGGDQVGKTIKANVAPRAQGFSLKDQTKSIRDAVAVARALGFQYLWIDSLCIVQDDNEDMARELGRMHYVYQKAHLTISAARSTASKDGFLGRCQPLCAVSFKYRGPDGTLGTVVAHLKATGQSEPIHERAWTLQEHLLSKRLLVFGSFGLGWVCRDASHSDGVQENAYGVRTEISERIADRGNPAQSMEWGEVVGRFSSRSLTDHNDRLPTVSAIAVTFSAVRNPGQYLAGLWETSLHDDLLWQVDDLKPSVPRDQQPSFPSWSWASMRGPVEYSDYQFHNRLTVATLEFTSASVPPTFSKAPFGQVKHGVLHMAGHLVPVRCRAVGHEAIEAAFESVVEDEESFTPLWRWAHSHASGRTAIFDPLPSAVSHIPPNLRPCAGAILDSVADLGDAEQYFLLEVYGLVSGQQQRYSIRDRRPQLEDDSEEDDDWSGSEQEDTQLFSIGLVLRALDETKQTFSRIGLYLVEEPNSDTRDHIPESPRRPHLENWIRSYNKTLVSIV
ncbi:heterokaryon incompatibility protein-domain-containing protein [Ustulina deusta]|nr:heterokaryon incompatibility protein-domain-containing protein [Ustulina deusta]